MIYGVLLNISLYSTHKFKTQSQLKVNSLTNSNTINLYDNQKTDTLE